MPMKPELHSAVVTTPDDGFRRCPCYPLDRAEPQTRQRGDCSHEGWSRVTKGH
jgi:hypothetical protein